MLLFFIGNSLVTTRLTDLNDGGQADSSAFYDLLAKELFGNVTPEMDVK